MWCSFFYYQLQEPLPAMRFRLTYLMLFVTAADGIASTTCHDITYSAIWQALSAPYLMLLLCLVQRWAHEFEVRVHVAIHC